MSNGLAKPWQGFAAHRDSLAAVFLVAICAAVYVPKIASVILIDHDDVISVLTATCNHGRFLSEGPTGRWVEASQWHDFLELHRVGCFSQISYDLVHHDIHPPLYFWLLHCWFAIFDVSVFSGLALNLTLLGLGTVIVFRTCRTLDVSSLVSFIATLAWTLSLPSRTAIGVMRQYALFSVLAALLMFFAVLWLRTRHRRYLLGISGALVAGFLTHYQFAIPSLVVVAFCFMVLWHERAFKNVVELLSASFIAICIFLLIVPDFLESVLEADERAQSFSLIGLLQRIVSVVSSATQIFNVLDWSHPLPYGLLDFGDPRYLALNLINVLLGLGGLYIMFRLIVAVGPKSILKPAQLFSYRSLPLIAALASWLAAMAMYLTFVTPVHAIGLQYVHFVTPWLCVALAQAADSCWRAQIRRVATALSVLLVLLGTSATAIFILHRPEYEMVQNVAKADLLIVDTTQLGVMPTILWHAGPNTMTYVSTQQELLKALPGLPAGHGSKLIYVTSYAYGNSTDLRDQILRLLADRGYAPAVQQVPSAVPLVPLGGDIYEFRK